MENHDDEFPLVVEETVEDSKVRSDETKLFYGTYTMEGDSPNVMIRKDVKIKKGTYDIMNGIQHNSLVPHLNFYSEGNHGRLVVPVLETSFENWIRTGGQELIIDDEGNMTPLFKNMIIDICDVVENLCSSKISIKNLGLDNLYMANETTPRILVLVTEAEELQTNVSKLATWIPVRDIIGFCYKECNRIQTYDAKRFTGFIGQDKFTVKALRRYPSNWDTFTKGEYLLAIGAANQNAMRIATKRSGIKWPLNPDGSLPDLLSEIIDEEAKEGRTINWRNQFDYFILIRNIYKHFDTFTDSIKEQFSHTREGFISQLELWKPTLWQDVYDAVGWP